MSSRAERYSHSREKGFKLVDAHFESEGVQDMKYGMWFPLSSVIADLYSPSVSPTASEAFPVAVKAMDTLSDQEVHMRGSTWIYKLLNVGNVERRGTLSVALRTALVSSLDTFGETKSAHALAALENFSDLDLFLPEVSVSDFSQVSKSIKDKASLNLEGATLSIKKHHPRRAKKRLYKKNHQDKFLKLEKNEGTVSDGIPYGEFVIRTDDDKRLLTTFWTPGNLDELEGIKDTRRDSRYALSWDIAATGIVTRNLPSEVRSQLEIARRLRDNTYLVDYKRIVNADGIFLPADFSDGNDEVWFNISQENLMVLTRPIEIGSGFFELSAVDQFRLALRATQKGAMAQENLDLSQEGRSARLASPAPALSTDTISAFMSINLSEFRQEYDVLSQEAKEELQTEVMQNMMTGLFYPQRFLTYMDTANLFRFFPQLEQISAPHMFEIIGRLPDHHIYSKRQHIATHYLDRDEQDANEDPEIDLARRFNSFENPYFALFQAMIDTNLEYLPNVTNEFEALDALLSLDKQDFEPKRDNITFTSSESMGRYFDYDEDDLVKLMDGQYEILDKKDKIAYKTALAAIWGLAIASIITDGFGYDNISNATWIGSVVVTVPYLLRTLVYAIDALKPLNEIREIQRSTKFTDFEVKYKPTPKG